MMLKVNNEFLDFNDFVDVEKRVKLFERIDETLGDFSYAFNLSKTSRNLKILGNPAPDVKNKTIYHKIPCDLMDDSGLAVYKGYLKVERITDKIQCSFFSGNCNWISELSGSLTDIDFSDLQTELTSANIANSWDNTEGIIYPLIDAGALITRSYHTLMVEDFTGMIFVKTIFKRIFQSAGIKTQGDLFKDPIFNNLLLSKSTISSDDINSLSSYVKNNSDQVISTPAISTSNTQIEFDNDYDSPFFDGDSNAWNVSNFSYMAPVKEKVLVEGTIISEAVSGLTTIPTLIIYKNGFPAFEQKLSRLSAVRSVGFKGIVTVEIGDVLQANVTVENNAPGSVNFTVYANSTIKITPIFIYRTTGQGLVPAWTQAKLVSNVLALFCCITDYEPVSKILTINFFEDIKSKEPIDLSGDIEDITEDYDEFISSYGQSSLLKYQESDADSVKQYNLSNFISYGSGEILVDNDFIDNTADILESDFKAPITYLNEIFSASLERTQFLQLEENGDQNFTSVTLTGMSDAKFNVPDDTIYTAGELVRISDSTNAYYNGEYVIFQTGVGTGFITLRGVDFDTDATGKITKLSHTLGADDGVYIFINTQYDILNVRNYSRLPFFDGVTGGTNNAYAFFNIINTGMPINDMYKQGLSFGNTNNPLSYQRSLVDTYWGQVGGILNDPVKIKSIGHIPRLTFSRITPLRPIRIKTEETNNLYYLNRIGGYKESYLGCEVDIIKLS